MEEKFMEWLIEKRLDWLTAGKVIASEEELTRLLADGFGWPGEMNDSSRTCLALVVDRIMSERQAAYCQGVLDGIRLIREIFNQ